MPRDMTRVLIANRGEIARRIIRSCKAMNLKTVAVYSDADAAALFVEEADASVYLGPSRASDSYLRADLILLAAEQTEADAIHPGYGFLAENAEFAEAVIAAGLIWVGSDPQTLRDMGDKDRARAIARRANVPVVPGSDRVGVGSDLDIAAFALAVGYPLLVKAAAGGGGIGMRLVEREDKLSRTVEATQNMARKAFGDGTVFLERFVKHARHVEIQVFGYGDGSAIHLFERDCSLQRRFQKVIEESPAPGLRPDVLARMADAALSMCKATHYAGAGTVEFIVDAETQDFFFLEMNTRIQVEHPVTEMVTGVDLVAMQIALAAGRLDPVPQSEITTTGHAVECRLYAEKPEKNFMPSPGPLRRLRLPPDAPDLRIDCGYREGDEVSIFYDPMVAKIIAHGPNRTAACKCAIAALTQIEVEGIKTNRDFLIACLNDPQFQCGHVHTSFIDQNMKQLLSALSEGSLQ
ncbi:acetyl-CoA carboxylase biotin carboxylase subunit [Marivita sp.]|uniref:acetyl-CoA carboxylase biotin carboxylase subunit n=1 Tax=Marivita sp. TaxID=2003365 RepID=UPI003F70B773